MRNYTFGFFAGLILGALVGGGIVALVCVYG